MSHPGRRDSAGATDKNRLAQFEIRLINLENRAPRHWRLVAGATIWKKTQLPRRAIQPAHAPGTAAGARRLDRDRDRRGRFAQPNEEIDRWQ